MTEILSETLHCMDLFSVIIKEVLFERKRSEFKIFVNASMTEKLQFCGQKVHPCHGGSQGRQSCKSCMLCPLEGEELSFSSLMAAGKN
jgi:hypothetical protein